MLIDQIIYGCLYFSALFLGANAQACVYQSDCRYGFSGQCVYDPYLRHSTCQYGNNVAGVPLCPNGEQPKNSCYGPGSCQLNDLYCLENVGCCPIPQCPNGNVAMMPCQRSSECPIDFSCQNGGCCTTEGPSKTCSGGELPMTPSCALGYSYKEDAAGCCANENRPSSSDVCPKGELYYDPITLQTQQCSGGAVDTCPSKSVCNPMTGFCCSKLLLCSGKSQRPELTDLKKPKSCSAGCGSGYSCQESGFCCRHKNGHYGESCVDGGCFDETECFEGKCVCPRGQYRMGDSCTALPKLGEPCDEDLGCSGVLAICIGTCQCMTDFGYTPAANGIDCSRSRKRLDEACQSDSECRTAYTYCSEKKRCTCLPGFRKNSRTGGCMSNTAFICGDGSPPVLKEGAIEDCDKYPKYLDLARKDPKTVRQRDPSPWANTVVVVQSGTSAQYERVTESQMTDTCDDDSYCNTYYDQPRPDFYKGFCCKKPAGREPRCPIGQAHETSVSPQFGCGECPMTTHYCHEDMHSSGQGICCPKPCKNPSDVFDLLTGECYEPVGFNEPCEVDEQCIGSPDSGGFSSARLRSRNEKPQQCLIYPDGNNMCGCKLGYVEKNGKCLRAQCTIGIKGEPLSSYDKVTTMRCIDKDAGITQQDGEEFEVCPFGFLCDPDYQVCCHDVMGPPVPDPVKPNCPFFAPYFTGKTCNVGQHFECNKNTGVIRNFCISDRQSADPIAFCCSRDKQ